MKKISMLAALLVPALALADAGKLSDADLAPAAELHHANQAEVDMANLALKQGTKAVKEYAQTLLRDHGSNDKDLTALAKKHGSTIPAKKMDAEEMANMTKLKAAKGAAFDKTYVDMMVMDHEQDIKKVGDAMGAISDADLKQHFTATKPVLERHLELAKQLQSTTK